MKPNGFVAAASIADQMSTPRSPANIASSLTSAMFTCRNVFSSSLTSSASAGRARPARPCRRARRRTPRPPRSDVGVDARTRPSACSRTSTWGCRDRCARASSRGRSRVPARRPDCSRIGRSSSSVVPGYVVDSSTTSAPGCSARAQRRGRRLDEREVGRAVAQRRGHRDHRDVEAGEILDLVASPRSRARSAAASRSSGTSSTYERPARSASMRRRVELVADDAEARPRPRASRPAARRSPGPTTTTWARRSSMRSSSAAHRAAVDEEQVLDRPGVPVVHGRAGKIRRRFSSSVPTRFSST